MGNLKGKTAIIIAILLVFCYGIFGIPGGLTPAALKQALTDRIKLDLDLKGGTHLVLVVHVEEAIRTTTDRDVERIQHDYNAYDVTTSPNGGWTLTMKPGSIRDLETRTLDTSIETIRQRINSLGVNETPVQKYGLGDNEIVVELPGVDDPARVEDVIQSTARLEIHAVVGQPYESDQAALQALGGALPPEDELVRGSGSAGNPEQTWVLQRAAVVEGLDFRDAQPSTDQNGRPNIRFTLTTEAGDRFFKYTSAHSRDSSDPGSMAIVLDNKVREVASINSPIRDSGEIEGGFTRQQADDLSLMLRTGSLPASISFLETRTVGPSLGAASIHQGIVAAIA